jgi:glycosyltransferase involved in cell wall biosynthesis
MQQPAPIGSNFLENPSIECVECDMEVSIVMPCLNEADTVASCVTKAINAMKQAGYEAEVIVADNGSSDGSIAIAQSAGARIVHVPAKGYGSALAGGIAASNGRFIIMGDADDSYDFLESPRLIEPLQRGFDLAQGCRFPRGGGKIYPGAMPFLHRHLGNPVLSWLVRWMFRIPISDVYCGMRGFTRDLYDRLDLRSPGMEFATEMVIRSGTIGAKIAEVPLSLHPDGRKAHGPHLRTFRDGWRTLRLFLVFSPRWTFFIPGCFFIAVAALGYALSIPQVSIGGIVLDVHTLLVASLAGLLGWQSILLAVLARIFTGREGMLPRHERLEKLSVEHGLVAGIIAGVFGVFMIAAVIFHWWQQNFGPLDYPKTMRLVIPGVTFVAASFQTIIASLLAGVLQMHRER